ncbi:MAG: transglycosylase domain-containing protein [Clostridia bacterium]|nr:transglycosylase domain-containing protein [Clostridia bacterium]
MEKQKKVDSKKSKIFKRILFIVLIIFLLLIVFFSLTFFYLYRTTNLNTELLTEISTPAIIYDNNNTLLNENVQGLPYVKLENLQTHTINAFTSIEDKEFYNHNGINVKRIISALLTNIKSGSIQEGASTITQQLIKNTHLTTDKTYERKIKEIILALKLEQEYTKDEIMEMYLNAIYFGNGCYGIESASNFYFNKSASELTINESAILAGIIKSPAYYSPIENADNIEKRKNIVLDQMLEDKAITLSEYTQNEARELDLNVKNGTFESQSSYINSAITEAGNIVNMTPNQLIANKYKIYTYYDESVSKSLSQSIEHNTNAMHNAIVIDNKTGGIQGFNSSYTFGATTIQRTPASTIKPILVYGAGIEYGNIYKCSLLKDEPTIYENNYSPKNISNKYYGIISVEDALAKSLNIPAVNLFKDIGIEKCKSFAKKCGIKFDESDNGLSLALGAMKYGVTIQELNNAYLTFANNGNYKPSTFIKRIEDAEGNPIYVHNATNKKVMSEETAYLVGQMMKKTTTNGTCTSLGSFDFEIHAKSGTNGTKDDNYNTDAICVAQTTKHTACIWYFSKDNTQENLLENVSASQLSPTLKMKNLFENLYKEEKPENFKKPKNIVDLKLDSISYENGEVELATIDTPERYTIECEFNKKFTPKTISKNFTSIVKPTLTSVKNATNIELSFITLKHQKYELIKEYEKKGKRIKETLQVIKGKSDLISYKDDDIDENIAYTYYIKVSNDIKDDYEISNLINYQKKSNIMEKKRNYNFYSYFN